MSNCIHLNMLFNCSFDCKQSLFPKQKIKDGMQFGNHQINSSLFLKIPACFILHASPQWRQVLILKRAALIEISQ